MLAKTLTHPIPVTVSWLFTPTALADETITDTRSLDRGPAAIARGPPTDHAVHA